MTERRSKQHAALVDALLEFIPTLRIEEELYLGDGLYLDIFLPDFSIGIEVDGEQHFHFIEHFHKDRIAFEEQRLRDSKKERICIERGIFLYRLVYNDKRDLVQVVGDIFEQASKVSNSSKFEERKSLCKECGVSEAISQRQYCLKCLREHKRQHRQNRRNKWTHPKV